MKALNLKKTAAAVALSVAAGNAVAANTISVITGDVNTQVQATSALTDAQKVYVSVAKELASDKSAMFVDSATISDGTDASIEAIANTALVRLAMQVAPINGQFITYDFSNGGARFATAANLVAYNASTSTFANFTTAPQVVSQPTISGTDTTATSVTFKLDDIELSDGAATEDLGTNDFIFLVDGSQTIGALTSVALQGPDLYVNPGVAAGTKVSVDVIIKDTSNQNEIVNSEAAAVTFAEAFTGLSVNDLSSAEEKVIDYAADALKFTENTTTVSRTASKYIEVETPSTALAAKDTSSVAYLTGASGSATNKVFGSFDLTADKCAAVDTSDDTSTSATADVTLFGATATASSIKDCTWGVSAQELALDGDLVTSVRVDGKTVIENSSWSYTGVLTLGSSTKTDIAKEWKNVDGKVFTFTSDVQGDSIQIPYIYHIGSASGYASLVKVTNKNAVSTSATATNMVELAFNAVIKNTTTGEQFSVENYKLADVANQGQAEITGADVINALITPVGKASDGFNETAMDLDTAENFHIALELIPRNQGNNTNFFIDVQNTSPVGRAQGSVEYSAH